MLSLSLRAFMIGKERTRPVRGARYATTQVGHSIIAGTQRSAIGIQVALVELLCSHISTFRRPSSDWTVTRETTGALGWHDRVG